MTTVVAFFTEDHVTHLTGLTKRQLRAWDKRGFFAPRHADVNPRTPYSRVYAFRDVVGLKTIAVLIQDYGLKLAVLREVAAELSRLDFDHWADVTLDIVNQEVHFRPSGTDRVAGDNGEQPATLLVIDVIQDVTRAADAMKQRSPAEIGRIERNRYILRNAPRIAGTRIPVSVIKQYVDAGFTAEQIVADYPTLTKADIDAARSYSEKLAHPA